MTTNPIGPIFYNQMETMNMVNNVIVIEPFQYRGYNNRVLMVKRLNRRDFIIAQGYDPYKKKCPEKPFYAKTMNSKKWDNSIFNDLHILADIADKMAPVEIIKEGEKNM